MKENYKNKMKSLMVAILMIASAMFVFIAVEKVEATAGDGIEGSITQISWVNGTDFAGNTYNKTLVVNGLNVSGTVRFGWTSTVTRVGGDNAVNYNVTFSQSPDTGFASAHDGGNLSQGSGNNTYYVWNTELFTDGVWYINVTGAVSRDGDLQWVNGTLPPRKLVVRNSLPGTPGVDQYQGGRFAKIRYGERCLVNDDIDYKIGTEYDINIYNTGLWSTTRYYLYKPIYKGSTYFTGNTQYELQWDKTAYNFYGNQLTGTEFEDITFDVAGLWVIDAENDSFAAASFRTIDLYNSTVDAWFWVNTSQTYLMNNVEDTFVYNSSGTLDITITDADGGTTADDYRRPTVDIRDDDNGSSINIQNQQMNSGWTGFSNPFYKNNSYDGRVWPGEKGFWNVGNYSVYGYLDWDRIKDVCSDFSSAVDYHGVQEYSETNMGSSANGKVRYNLTYGSNASRNGSATWLSTAERYNYTLCGPWDPPEYNVTVQPIRVTTGTPYAVVETGNDTMYWGFDGQVNISFGKTSTGTSFNPTDVKVSIWNDDDVNVSNYFRIKNIGTDTPDDRAGRVFINETHYRGGRILINMTDWGQNKSKSTSDAGFGDNGTWYAKIYVDYNGDRKLNGEAKEYSEEWNTTVSWEVTAGPTAQFKWIDDDGSVGGLDLWGYEEKNNDGIIPYIPTKHDVPLDVEFYVYGSDGSYFGDVTSGLHSGRCEDVLECAENITISGDSLFTGKLSDYPGYGLSVGECGYSSGVWSIPIIPTMSVGGRTITIDIAAFNSSTSATLSIGGEKYEQNGSVVSVTPNEFMIDRLNQTLTITVQNAETGVDNPYSTMYLYYLDDYTNSTSKHVFKPMINHEIVGSAGVTASGGVYTFTLNMTHQTFNQTTGLNALGGAGFANVKAPRNLTVYVDGPGQREGYALIKMTPVNDLEVHIEGESEFTMMAGKDYDDFTISCDFVNGTAGKSDTDTPSTKTADKNTFFMKIVDINGDDVTATLLNGITATKLTGTYVYSYDHDNVYGTDDGTYYIYAWNNTHNSKGHNATLIVKSVEVACDKAPFIWSVDKNISATFTITYDGSPANGTLRIDNISDVGKYNRTFANCSFNGNSDAAGNTSIQIAKTKIVNGVITVHDITANYLKDNASKQYISFWFKPTESGSVYALSKTKVNIEVPSVTPDTEYIPLGRTTKVYCTATGRGETLRDVYIRLHGQGYDQNATTDVDGRVAFSVIPSSTGNISIDVGQKGRTLPDTVIKVVAWVIDASTDVAEVDEGEDFTVTVIKEGTTDVVVGATVTIVGIGTDTTDANGQVTFTAPEVTSDRTYTIKVTKEGYAPDPDTNTIMVINIPRLTIVLPDEVQATTTFEVAVADDTGGAIVGAIITFNEKTYTTGVNGIAKLTAPGTAGDYPIKATFGTYVEATGTVTVTAAPGIPGFELLTLVAALGVAFILFRRRRR